MTIKINAQFGNAKAKTVESVVLELAKAHCRTVGATVSSLTDNSGASAGTSVVALSTSLANTAASGTNLASHASVETAVGTVIDALNELAVKANAYATALGLSTVSYSGGGAAADGTIAALTLTSTGASTGGQAASVNTLFGALNNAFYNVTVVVNEVAKAQGLAQLAVPAGVVGAVSAITNSAGADASPGVTKAAVDAELAKAGANVALLASKLNAFNDGVTVALVTPV
jgi:hypothetical protein